MEARQYRTATAVLVSVLLATRAPIVKTTILAVA